MCAAGDNKKNFQKKNKTISGFATEITMRKMMESAMYVRCCTYTAADWLFPRSSILYQRNLPWTNNSCRVVGLEEKIAQKKVKKDEEKVGRKNGKKEKKRRRKRWRKRREKVEKKQKEKQKKRRTKGVKSRKKEKKGTQDS